MGDKSKQKLPFIVISVLAGIYAVFWVLLKALDMSEDAHLLFGAVYGTVALAGGVYALISSRRFGGLKSVIGRMLFYLGLGLIFVELGQLSFSYYNIVRHVDIPYPSVADIWYFGAIPLYIMAAYNLSKAVGAQVALRQMKGKVIAVVVPVVLLLSSYLFFIKSYSFEDKSALTVFLDFGYPVGQAIYVSIALAAYLFATGMLGGVMKKRLLLLFAAFIAQYAADFNFLYQTIHGTWTNGGYGDLIYLIAYTLMGLSLVMMIGGLLSIGSAATKQPIAGEGVQNAG